MRRDPKVAPVRIGREDGVLDGCKARVAAPSDRGSERSENPGKALDRRCQLGLRDWVIDFERTRAYDLRGCLGTCSTTFSKQRVTIRLLAHGDNDPSMDPVDDERVLVHELLHVRLAGLQHRDWDDRPDSTEWQFCVEHPIQRLALTLVELRRQANPFSWEADEKAIAQHVGEQTLREMRATDA